MDARLFDGQSALDHPVRIEPGPDGFTLAPLDPGRGTPECPAHWRFADTHEIEGHDPDMVTLSTARAPEARLLLPAGPFAQGLVQRCAGAPATGSRWQRHRTAFVAIGLTFVTLGLVLAFLGPLASAVAQLAPYGTGGRLSDNLIASLSRISPSCTGAEGQKAFDRLTAEFATTAGIPAPSVTVLGEDEINAFAFPGGRIVMLDGLIQRAKSPSEVAAVLAHEIGHVVHRDPIAGFARQHAVSLLLSLVFGPGTSAGSGLGAVEGLTGYMLNASYTRGQEAEADRAAIELLRASGITSRGAADFFARLDDKQTDGRGVTALLSTHPHSAGRESRMREARTGTGQGFTDEEWRAIQSMCD